MIGDFKLFYELDIGDVFILGDNNGLQFVKKGKFDVVYVKPDWTYSYMITNPGFLEMRVITLCD